MKSLVFLVVFVVIKMSAADCDVIPMKQWAGEPTFREEVLQNPVDLVVVQHTVTPEFSTDEDCEAAIRVIRRYHVMDLRFTDVGQSFFICGNGKVYEGAGWQRVGAHTKKYNNISIGISFIGRFDDKLPSPSALNAAINLLSCGKANNHLTKDYQVVGHRQVTSTLSPGDALQREIESWPHWVDGRGRH